MFGHCASELQIFLAEPWQCYSNKLSKTTAEKCRRVMVHVSLPLHSSIKCHCQLVLSVDRGIHNLQTAGRCNNYVTGGLVSGSGTVQQSL